MKFEVDTPQKIFNLLMRLADDEKKRYYFRGIQRANERYPKIMRVKNDIDLSYLEGSILSEFMNLGKSFTGSSNALDCVSYAQHFGLPTRLVDWTSNPFVALFFALYYAELDGSKPSILVVNRRDTITLQEAVYLKDAGETGIGGLNPIREFMRFCDQIEHDRLLDIINYHAQYIEEIPVGLYYEEVKAKVLDNKMIIVDCGFSNARLIAQSGVFYIPKSLVKDDIDLEYKNSNVDEIPIDINFKERLLTMIRKIGIDKSKLFFDQASICEFIKEQALKNDEKITLGAHLI